MLKVVSTILVGVFLVIVASVVMKALPDGDGFFGLDNFFHFSGGIFAAWCSYLFLEKFKIGNKLAMIVVGGLLIGLAWEVCESISSTFGQTYWPLIYKYYRGGGITDTMSDLVFDFGGILFFILIYYYKYCRGSRTSTVH